MSILDEIVARRRRDVARARREVPSARLAEAATRRVHRSLRARLTAASAPVVIAECKQASPSAGLLSADYDPAARARAYEAAGASAVSVLTEPHYFRGSLDDLEAVRKAVSLPLLRKDFMVDEYQVLEAAAHGADVILLIMAVLEPGMARDLAARARELGLEVLVESHTAGELAAAREHCPGAIYGINSRNLATLETDLSVARTLAAALPAGEPAVAESGIRTPADVRGLWASGFRGFLVGESVMRDGEGGALLRALVRAREDAS